MYCCKRACSKTGVGSGIKNRVNKTNQSFKFIDEDAFGNHLIMLYEDDKRAFAAKLRYLNNGLIKGERAIFLTNENPKYIEDKMSHSIDVKKFRKMGLLHILQIQENISTEEALKQFEKVIKLIESSPKAGFRLAGGPVIVKTGDKIVRKMRTLIEKRCQKVLSKHKGSILCPYKIIKARDDYEKEWMCDMFRKHTDVIYVPKLDKVTSFNADFML